MFRSHFDKNLGKYPENKENKPNDWPVKVTHRKTKDNKKKLSRSNNKKAIELSNQRL